MQGCAQSGDLSRIPKEVLDVFQDDIAAYTKEQEKSVVWWGTTITLSIAAGLFFVSSASFWMAYYGTAIIFAAFALCAMIVYFSVIKEDSFARDVAAGISLPILEELNELYGSQEDLLAQQKNAHAEELKHFDKLIGIIEAPETSNKPSPIMLVQSLERASTHDVIFDSFKDLYVVRVPTNSGNHIEETVSVEEALSKRKPGEYENETAVRIAIERPLIYKKRKEAMENALRMRELADKADVERMKNLRAEPIPTTVEDIKNREKEPREKELQDFNPFKRLGEYRWRGQFGIHDCEKWHHENRVLASEDSRRYYREVIYSYQEGNVIL